MPLYKATASGQVEMTPEEETEFEASRTISNEAFVKALMSSIVDAVQSRLDNFSRTRNYDGILSACTYTNSTVLKFQSEGQYCVQARDATWSRLYELMAEVENGTRPMPASYADVESELPALVWPQ